MLRWVKFLSITSKASKASQQGLIMLLIPAPQFGSKA